MSRSMELDPKSLIKMKESSLKSSYRLGSIISACKQDLTKELLSQAKTLD